MENKSRFFVINIVDKYVKEVSGNWWLVFFNGLVAIALGASFIVWPVEALKIFAYFIGVLIILFGLQYIKLSFKVKKIEKNYEKVKEDIKSKFE
ncbi:DUF308 domain-containing protein [bacterium]|jgi:uncharacterized membrane protein HdeD (DUF308 family)|nr:DUF308 domain-containing protein [bacterium]